MVFAISEEWHNICDRGDCRTFGKYRRVDSINYKLSFVLCFVLVFSATGCSYHRAHISFSECEEDLKVPSSGWEGRRLGTVRTGEGGAIWERCTDVAEGSLWILMEDARMMGGNAIGEVR